MITLELTKSPSTLSLYRRAVTNKKSGLKPGEALPDLRIKLNNNVADPEKIKSYAKVCGFKFGDTMPATYPHMLAFPLQMELMVHKNFPFALLGLVHVSNRITQKRPIRINEGLDMECRLASMKTVDKGIEFSLDCYAYSNGEEVWTSTSTMLHRCKTDISKADKQHDDTEYETVVPLKMAANLGRRYAKVSGDSNPIHLYPLTAKLLGFKRHIAHGMWSKARCLAELQDQLPDAFTVEIGFKLPVFLPAKIQMQYNANDNGTASFELKDSNGIKPHLKGTIKAA